MKVFNYREFLMTGFRDAIGKQADHQIVFNANGFYEKGVLLEEDLQELDKLIYDKNNPIAEALPTDEVIGG